MASDGIYEFSEPFQLKILALYTRDKTVFHTYREVIEPKFFRKDIHIDLCRIVTEHYDEEQRRSKQRGTPITSPTVEVLWEEVRKLCAGSERKAKLKEQYQDAVLDIMEVDLTDAEYIKDSIVSFGKNQAMKHAILDSVDDLEKGDYSKIEERVQTALRVGEDVSDLGVDFFAQAEERMEKYAKGIDGVERIPTGMAGIDKVMKGGCGRGELGVIIAPPNRGKSIALTNIGFGAISAGYNVVHFTLEMPEPQVAKRYDGRLVGKDFGYIKDNTSKVLTSLRNMQKHLKAGKLFIKKYRTNQATVNTLRSYLTRLWMEYGFKPDVVIVDYADLLTPARTYADKRFELESIYLDLRDLGDEFNCAVWTASQTNRGGLDKKVITIGDLAEAFNKANIADFMAALCQTLEEKEDGEMRIHVAKFRDGEANITLDAEIEYPTYTLKVPEMVA